jgi:hypothetical protein
MTVFSAVLNDLYFFNNYLMSENLEFHQHTINVLTSLITRYSGKLLCFLSQIFFL